MYAKPTLCLLLLSLAAPLLFAQTINVEKLGGLQYRLVGPHRGGRVTAACGVPQQPFTFFFGAAGGGAYERYEGLKRELQPQLEELEAVIAGEVQPFNQALEEMGVTAIMVE